MYKDFFGWAEQLQGPYPAEPEKHVPSMREASLWNAAFHVKPERNKEEGIHTHVCGIWQCCGIDGWNGLVYLSKETDVRSGPPRA